jgi:integrase
MIHGRIHKGTFPTRRAAILFLEKIALEGRGIYSGTTPELAEAIDAYIEECRQAGRSNNTLRYYEAKRRNLEHVLGGSLNRITQHDIDSYIRIRQRAGISNGTVNKELHFLKSVYTFAQVDPPWRHRALSHRSKRKRVYPPEVVRELLQRLPESSLRAVSLCLFVGMRAEEVWRADTSWIHDNEIEVAMQKSGGDTNRTWLVESVRKLLPADGKLIEGPWHATAHEIRRTSAELGFAPPIYGPGIFRHHCSTYGIELGFPRDQVKLVLGHQFGDVTDRYIHSQQITKKREVLEAVEGYVLGTVDVPPRPDSTENVRLGDSANH